MTARFSGILDRKLSGPGHEPTGQCFHAPMAEESSDYRRLPLPQLFSTNCYHSPAVRGT